MWFICHKLYYIIVIYPENLLKNASTFDLYYQICIPFIYFILDNDKIYIPLFQNIIMKKWKLTPNLIYNVVYLISLLKCSTVISKSTARSTIFESILPYLHHQIKIILFGPSCQVSSVVLVRKGNRGLLCNLTSHSNKLTDATSRIDIEFDVFSILYYPGSRPKHYYPSRRYQRISKDVPFSRYRHCCDGFFRAHLLTTKLL